MAKNYLSVAMCIYNGGRYLSEQLESIAFQSSLPGELVICDDGSTDASIDIIKAFARHAPFKVCLTINSKRLGATKNFAKAIDSCSGEIIALSDQDDVWNPEKLRLIQSQFSNSSRVGLVFTDADLVDASLNSLGYRLWESVGFNKAKQRRATEGDLFRVLLKRNYVTGATLAFRAHFKTSILPIPEIFVHDAWIAIILSVLTDTAIIPESLIQYRQHADNQIGAIKTLLGKRLREVMKSDKYTYLHEADKYILVFERLLELNISSKGTSLFTELEGKINHLQNRARMRMQPGLRFGLSLRELVNLRYHYFSDGWLSFGRDLLGSVSLGMG
jgi:glycosyltransferase involved in cell wall biosynthesis